MGTALLVAAIVIGVAACPLMAVLQRRRGRVGCCPPIRSKVAETLAELKADRDRVEQRISAIERDASSRVSVPR